MLLHAIFSENWQGEYTFQPRSIIGQVNRAAMQAHDCLHQTQPQPISLLVTALIKPDETLKHTLVIMRRNTNAVISNNNASLLTRRKNAHCYYAILP